MTPTRRWALSTINKVWKILSVFSLPTIYTPLFLKFQTMIYLKLLTDKNYQPTIINATADGGCLVVGSIGDYQTQRFDVFALKINADGSVGTKETIVEDICPYACWPNPAKDVLHLSFSPDVQPAQAELYDLQGRLVRTWCNGLETLNLQGLAPGTYTMRVTLEGGKVFSDKVVKE